MEQPKKSSKPTGKVELEDKKQAPLTQSLRDKLAALNLQVKDAQTPT